MIRTSFVSLAKGMTKTKLAKVESFLRSPKRSQMSKRKITTSVHSKIHLLISWFFDFIWICQKKTYRFFVYLSTLSQPLSQVTHMATHGLVCIALSAGSPYPPCCYWALIAHSPSMERCACKHQAHACTLPCTQEVETCHVPLMERSGRVASHQWVQKWPITLGPPFQDVTALRHLVHPIMSYQDRWKLLSCWDPDWGTSFAEEVSRLWPQGRAQQDSKRAFKWHRCFGRHAHCRSSNMAGFLWISRSLHKLSPKKTVKLQIVSF